MKLSPTLRSEQLVLREFTVEDASNVQRLDGEWEAVDWLERDVVRAWGEATTYGGW
jgi:hypothetical protein